MRICCAKRGGGGSFRKRSCLFVIYKMEKRGNVGRNKKKEGIGLKLLVGIFYLYSVVIR
jgi:hypothetical protein